MAAERICKHDPELDCGCWEDEDGKVQRHAFRFLVGDKVRHAEWAGFTGTVVSKSFTGGYVVEWDKHKVGLTEVAPSGFQSNFEITHIEEVQS